MSLFSSSTDAITGKIASIKTIIEKSSSTKLKSTSGTKGLMESVVYIFKQLGGYDDMIKVIENIISSNLDHIEILVKNSIKISLKEIISCSVDPTIDDDLILNGLTLDLKVLDPISILNIDPISTNGSYAYFDNTSGINSNDFNVFLYTTIKYSINNSQYSGSTWYKTYYTDNVKHKSSLMKVKFIEYDESTAKSNQLNIKISENYRGQKLSKFISDFLDSIKLFNNVQILSKLFDNILGSNILSINKTADQLAIEDIISNICDNIINNADDDTVIDDSYYQFSNNVYNELLENAEKKKSGKFSYSQINNIDLSINQDLLLDSLNDIKADGLLISEQTTILKNTIDNITNDLVEKSKINDKDSYSFKVSIIEKIIKNLATIITLTIFSPKVLFLFSLSNKIFGKDDDSNIIDFIKNNINLYKMIILSIRDIILNELISKLKELITPIISQVIKELIKEKFAIYKSQIDGFRKSLGL